MRFSLGKTKWRPQARKSGARRRGFLGYHKTGILLEHQKSDFYAKALFWLNYLAFPGMFPLLRED